eukprot:COSAG06_NODE_24937_length_649_cov_0.567273_1_plen_74_part_10
MTVGQHPRCHNVSLSAPRLPADIGILMDMFGSAFGGVLYNFTDNNLHDLAQGVADSAGFYSGKAPRSLLASGLH